jgi:ribosome biogenesis GTPase
MRSFVFFAVKNKKKITASNVDCVIIVCAVSKPEYKQGMIDRYLLRAVQWEIPAIVVFNKMDEFDGQIDLAFEHERVKELIHDSYEVCSKGAHKAKVLSGIEKLESDITGKTALILGASGVGKSKLISKLSGGKIELKSNELAKVGKGAHTTTWAELVDCGKFELIDSPGVRSFSLDDMNADDIKECFVDLHPYFAQCKFNDCAHLEDSKGCAFHSIDDEKILSRLDSYLRFIDEVSSREDWQKNY